MKNKIEIFIYENFTKIFYAAIFIFVFCALTFSQQAGIGSSSIKKHNHSGNSQGGSIQALKLTGNFFIEGNNEGNIVMPSTPATGANFIYYPAKSSLYAGFTNSANPWYVKDVYNTINLGSYNSCGNYSSCIGYGASVSTSRYNSHTFGNYLKTTANNAITIGQGNLTNYAVNTDTNSIKIYNDNVLNSGKPIISISSYGVVNINNLLVITTYSVVGAGANIQTYETTLTSTSPYLSTTLSLNANKYCDIFIQATRVSTNTTGNIFFQINNTSITSNYGFYNFNGGGSVNPTSLINSADAYFAPLITPCANYSYMGRLITEPAFNSVYFISDGIMSNISNFPLYFFNGVAKINTSAPVISYFKLYFSSAEQWKPNSYIRAKCYDR